MLYVTTYLQIVLSQKNWLTMDTLDRDHLATNITQVVDDYDSNGALLFTVLVLVIYGSSIIAFIAYSVRASKNSPHSPREDREVERFLTYQEELDRMSIQDKVFV